MITALTILFISLAAVFKAISDTLKDHFSVSVFKWKDPRFWNPEISYKYVGFIRFTRYRPDAWHLSNSGMIICFCLAAVIHQPVLSWYYELAIAGLLFNLIFNVFYNHLLKS
jgi:hypothetical protein